MPMWLFLFLKLTLLVSPVPSSIGALANDLLTIKAHESFIIIREPRIIDEARAHHLTGQSFIGPAPLEPTVLKVLPVAADKKDRWPRGRAETTLKPALTARSAYVMDKDSGAVFYQKEAETARPIASLTKLLSAVVFLNQNPDFNKTVVITEEDGLQGRLYLEVGEEIKAKDLFFTSLTGSSNNATMALARSTGLGLAKFVEQMNEQARHWGLKKTTVVEPTGLNPTNQSTAREIAYLLKNVLDLLLVRQATTLKNYFFRAEKTGWEHQVQATDELLSDSLISSKIKKINGGKTGFIDEAGFNFAVEVEDEDGHQIIVVVLGADSHWSRFSEAKDLAEWVFSNFLWPDQEGFAALPAP